ncbi:MAG: LLM class flavin-dependent oxidoreductase [Proteobacteria bacterium]|nr:LLM class flavin-dependent oxidoreductase [Pseudomonadota bacterium]
MRQVSNNKMMMGIFAANCSGGIGCTTIPEKWQPTWENNLAIAQMADDAGLEFMLPLGRWAGYGGETDHNGISYETMTWASGLLASTKNIMAFGTVHVALINPIAAAKQMVTADHIGGGRFGLNIVCGWNMDEYGMFGVELKEHDRRYDQGAEWLEIVKRLWTEEEPFDHEGEFYSLKRARAEPKPISNPWPMLMSAGSSEAGLAFAVNNAEFLFRGVYSAERAADDIKAVRSAAGSRSGEIGVFTNAYIVCRPTGKEAEAYHHYYAVENADEGAVDTMYVGRGIRDNSNLSDEVKAELRLRIAGGNSAYPIIGDPDQVAEKIKTLSDMGFAGLAIGLVNYVEHFPYVRDEVLPRLERLGLREPFKG